MTEERTSQDFSASNGIARLETAWEDREGFSILATVDETKKPNAIYVGEIGFLQGEGFVVANNYFKKTFANLQAGNLGSLLFLTKERKSFQAKGPLTYHTSGPDFDFMKSWHDPKHPGLGAVLLRVEEAYSGAERIL
jgi:predicted pyridoxine 5'-phosphate oxidase superfamily flavin-nucleotide-binding protein